MTIEAETDEVRDQIGFRSIETKGTEILLNGSPIFLRGICIHEEAPLRGGRANSREDAQTLLGWAKELGANFVRLAHYPHNEYMVREADRLGNLVWSEIPVYWTIEWENPATLENARNQLGEMIARDKNRAAVVIWSVANETPLSDARLAFLKNLIAHARSLDSTRLLSAAMERHYINQTTQMIDDPLGEYLDVLGCNEYVGWYDGLPEKADRLEWRSKYQKPLVMSEFGGDALYGHHGDALTRWTEEYQESIYQHQIAMLKKIPIPARHIAMDPDGLPLSAPPAAKDPGLLEPQGIDFKSRREEESVLTCCSSGIVSCRIKLTTDNSDFTARFGRYISVMQKCSGLGQS